MHVLSIHVQLQFGMKKKKMDAELNDDKSNEFVHIVAQIEYFELTQYHTEPIDAYEG